MSKKNISIKVMSVVFVAVLSIVLLSSFAFANSQADNNNARTDVGATDIVINPQNNTTDVAFSITEMGGVSFDTVNVVAVMNYKAEQKRLIEKQIPLSDITIEDDTGHFNVDFKDFGQYYVNVRLISGTEVVKEVYSDSVGVTADTYNIAPISGNLPLTSLLLSMWGNDSVRHDGPVMLFPENPNCINWDNLPASGDGYYGMYAFPYLTNEETRTTGIWYSRLDTIRDYVASLKEISPNSRFNLFCSDYATGLINKVIYSNDLQNYNVVLYSDGNYTYTDISSTYTGSYEYNNSINNEKLQEWSKQEAEARASHQSTDYGKKVYSQNNLYAVVCADTKVTLKLTNKDLVHTDGDNNKFANDIKNNSRVVQETIDELFDKNIKPSDQAANEIKALYNFDESYFKKAKDANKDVLMCIGSANSEPNLNEYLRYLSTYYNNKYICYYKGDYNTPSSADKIKELDTIHIDDVDANIPTSLVLFFNENTKLCGYSSPSFSSYDSGQVLAMFNMTKYDGITSPIKAYNNCDFWTTSLAKCSDEKIKQLGTDDDFLIEFNDEIMRSEKYDIAIWDPIFGVAKYYKLNGDEYKFVKEQQGQGSSYVLPNGIYYIESDLSDQFVLDVAGGSKDNGANVQGYTCNASDAQKWRIMNRPDNYVSIINVGSGKSLDVANGSTSRGANVQQYDNNGSDAQKWKLYKTDDDKIKIISALNHQNVLDISGASAIDGANVQVYDDNGTSAQKFRFHNLTPDVKPVDAGITNGSYKICSCVDPTKLIDISGPSQKNGANIHLWQDLGLDNQVFDIKHESDGYYRIISNYSGKAVDVDNGFPFDCTNVQQWDYYNNDAQKWQITNNNGKFVFVNVASGLALDLFSASTANGTNIDVYSSNGTSAQSWQLVKVKSMRERLDELALANKGLLSDGMYYLNSKVDDNFAVEVGGASHQLAANVQLYSNNKTQAQQWLVSHDSKGYITFTNKESGKVMDVASGNSSSGTNVQQWDSNNSYAQKWIAVQDGSSFKIVSALNINIVLDVANGSAKNKSNIQIYSSNDTDAQRWLVSKIS